MTIDLSGIFPPIPTPFINGAVAYDKLEFNIKKWSKTGIRGFVVLGSNGEYVSLSEREKRKVIATAVQSSPGNMLIIAGTGCESTIESIKLTNDCAKLGAHAALVVTPHYFSDRIDDRALINYYTMLADHSPIPIILYNVPKFTHINLSIHAVSVLSKHSNIIGIKASSGNINLISEYLNNTEKKFNVLIGTAGVLFTALTLGCTGGILALANIAPSQCIKVFNLVNEGEFDEARDLQLTMIPVNKTITTTYGIGGLKTALDMLGYFGGSPRLPLLPCSQHEKKKIQKILKNAGLLD